MKINPIADVVLVCKTELLEVHFARIPDHDVVADLYSLHENPGIEICDENALTNRILDRQRGEYYLDVSPVYSVHEVADTLAKVLHESHNLEVVIQDKEGGPDDNYVVVTA